MDLYRGQPDRYQPLPHVVSFVVTFACAIGLLVGSLLQSPEWFGGCAIGLLSMLAVSTLFR